MPRRFLKRKLPDIHSVLNDNRLRWIGLGLKDSDLFHLNRRSVSMAFGFGLFTAFIPVPGQLLIAALFALALRCNLPITMALVFISNPVTVPPLALLCYQVGTLVLGKPETAFNPQFSWEWLSTQGAHLLPPLLTGSLLIGAATGLLGYATIRGLWRWQAVRRWEQRKTARSDPTRNAAPGPEAPLPRATPDTTPPEN
ncbi:MAG: DUF2062 domain-containing protein [Gammaproteobacteria bacterium]|nr:DUF2062 domain-containing protein [Gammaproteobacteria bacterium]